LSRPRAPIRPANSNVAPRAATSSSPSIRNIAKSAATAHVSGAPTTPATGNGIAPPNPTPPNGTAPVSASVTLQEFRFGAGLVGRHGETPAIQRDTAEKLELPIGGHCCSPLVDSITRRARTKAR